jgi:exopolysaccharide biosynthesis polyprenyl glycosylphosphotransferase
MTRPLRRLITHIGLLVLDASMAFLGFGLAYWVRYGLQLGRAVQEGSYLPFASFLWIGLTLIVIALVIFEARGLYSMPRGASQLETLTRVAGGITLAIAVLVVVLFGTQTYYTRLLYAYAWFTMIFSVSMGRVALAALLRWLWRQGIGVERVLVVGAGPMGQRVMRIIRQQPQLGYFLVGFLAEQSLPENPEQPKQQPEDPLRYLGRPADLSLLLEPCRIDEVIIALPSEAHDTTLEVANRCQGEGVGFRIVPDIYEMSFDRVDIAQLGEMPLIGLKEVAIRGWNLVVKRALDITLSLVALLAGAPLWLLIAAAIKLDSPGAILFSQKRIGRRGRPFTVFKFRTMHQYAEMEKDRLAPLNEASGPLFKIRSDPRVTRVGRLLRRTSLDELPQILNILMGEMSWVGPRPGTPDEVARYEPWQRKRLEVMPGLTGLWQTSGRSDISFAEMVRLDIYYIENWNLWLDIIILLRTIPAVISGRGAY